MTTKFRVGAVMTTSIHLRMSGADAQPCYYSISFQKMQVLFHKKENYFLCDRHTRAFLSSQTTFFSISLAFFQKLWYTETAKPTEYVARAMLSSRDSYILFLPRLFEFDKMQIPTGCGKKWIWFLASSVGLATIGVCIFSATTSVVALFIFLEEKHK